MANTIACPRCHRVGCIRYRTVVKAGRPYVTFACGGCTHCWHPDEEVIAPAENEDRAPEPAETPLP